MPITPAGYRPPPAAGPPSVRPARAPAWLRSAGGKREQGGARGRPEEWYVERREAHTWRRKGCKGEGKGRREEWNTGVELRGRRSTTRRVSQGVGGGLRGRDEEERSGREGREEKRRTTQVFGQGKPQRPFAW